jgi:hypothetical protein
MNIEDKIEAYNSEEHLLLFVILEGNFITFLFCKKQVKDCLSLFIVYCVLTSENSYHTTYVAHVFSGHL